MSALLANMFIVGVPLSGMQRFLLMLIKKNLVMQAMQKTAMRLV